MPPVFPLAVTHFDQQPGLCGAAVAQMILFYKGLAGNQTADQNALWARIQYHTTGVRPASPPAVVDPTDCPTWSTQQCDQCSGDERFRCWCTYPPPLHATLAVDYPLPMVLTTPGTDDLATAAAMDSADFDIPAAALVLNGLHWIAVIGYETGGPNPKTINGKQVSAIYIADPEVGIANHSVSMTDWFDDFVSPVNQCGAFQNLNVMIAATGPLVVAPGSGRMPVAAVPTRKPIGRPHHPPRQPSKPRPPHPRPRRPKPRPPIPRAKRKKVSKRR